jgi:adenylosuccinate lyase
VAKIQEQSFAPSQERVDEIASVNDHDTASIVDDYEEQLGLDGRLFHYGLTSSDVVDTALSLQIQDAGRLVLAGIDRALAAVVTRAEEHRHTICIGRSHGVHAEPTTFGWKLAGWAFELDRARTRVSRALETNRVGQLSGTVGTYAQVEPDVERIACERLGLEPDPLSTQVIARDRHAELLSTLALAATSLDRFATEIRHLARTEVREVEEPFGKGMKGSSAMPHKRNPKVAERICGLARVVRANSLVGLENVPLWHERDISQSSAERVIIPDSFLALDYMLDRFTWIVEGLVVHPERMLRNLESSHGLVFSHRLLLALIEAGLPRDDAYRLVQGHAMRAWEEEADFAVLVRSDPEISGRTDLDAVFDLAATVRHVDTVFDRLQALAQKEEPVHA